jgi:hypothetical protein
MVTWILPAVLAVAGVVAPPPVAGGTVVCRGEPAVLVDEAGDWVGTARRDVVAVVNADAEVFGNDGDDLICVYPDGRHYSGATVHGGPGNDTIVTYGGSNQITGDDGGDTLMGGAGPDSLSGGDGAGDRCEDGPGTAFGADCELVTVVNPLPISP